MQLHGKNFIGDKLSAGSGETFTAVSPVDSTELPTRYMVATAAEVDEALTRSDQAFAIYGRTTGDERAKFLERIVDEITALGDDLLQIAHRETGLPLARLTGERARTTGQLKMFAQVAREGSWVDARIDTAIPDRAPLPKSDLRRMLVPVGPVVVFGSSNFPFAFSVAGGDTASALATGNTVVVKAHERHPGTSELVAGAIARAVAACGLPAGVFSMLHGSGKSIGIALVKHPLTQAVGFTGSHTAGRALLDAAASRPHPIPVFAEMSSLNPIFILPEAVQTLSAKIAAGVSNSLTLGVGQFCTKPGLIFGLKGEGFEGFLQQLAGHIESASPATMLHAGIRDHFVESSAKVEKIHGTQLLARSKTPAQSTMTQAQPWAIRTDVAGFLKTPELSEEVFGPFGVVISASTMRELENAAARLDGQLTATVHGTPADLAEATELLRILERKAGRLIINGYPTGVEVCPSMNHGGPYPASSDVRFTSVGTAALQRFVRPICYQDFPAHLLPASLRDENPLRLRRLVNGGMVDPA